MRSVHFKLGYFGIANMKKMMQSWDEWLRRRFRMYIWKQWKKPKTRIKNLIKLGMDNSVVREEIPCRTLKIEHPSLHMILFGRSAATILFQEQASTKMIALKGRVRFYSRNGV